MDHPSRRRVSRKTGTIEPPCIVTSSILLHYTHYAFGLAPEVWCRIWPDLRMYASLIVLCHRHPQGSYRMRQVKIFMTKSRPWSLVAHDKYPPNNSILTATVLLFCFFSLTTTTRSSPSLLVVLALPTQHAALEANVFHLMYAYSPTRRLLCACLLSPPHTTQPPPSPFHRYVLQARL